MIQSPPCWQESRGFWVHIPHRCLKRDGACGDGLSFNSFVRETERYFASSGVIFERTDDGEGNLTTVLVYPKHTTLRRRLHLPNDNLLSDEETKFLDFVTWMLQVDPDRRPLAGQALLHPWFDDVDLNDVSYVDN
jgi:serine/threonine protein kinase